jgi:catechol 2,3-dioxygenase-like lactoylglutathione lyase family enzyme
MACPVRSTARVPPGRRADRRRVLAPGVQRSPLVRGIGNPPTLGDRWKPGPAGQHPCRRPGPARSCRRRPGPSRAARQFRSSQCVLAVPADRLGSALSNYSAGMTIRRVMPNVVTEDIEESRSFYGDFLGMDVRMDEPGFLMLASPSNPTAQMTVVSPAAESWDPDTCRTAMAKEQGRLGEVAAIEASLAAAEQKLAAMHDLAARHPHRPPRHARFPWRGRAHRRRAATRPVLLPASRPARRPASAARPGRGRRDVNPVRVAFAAGAVPAVTCALVTGS